MALSLEPQSPTPASGSEIAADDDLLLLVVDPDGYTGFGATAQISFLFSDGAVEALLAVDGSGLVAPYTSSELADVLTIRRDGGWPHSMKILLTGSTVGAGLPPQGASLEYFLPGEGAEGGISDAPLTIDNVVEPQSPADFLEFDIGEVNDRQVMLTAAFPPAPEREVIYDAEGFSRQYANSEGPTENEDGSLHFKLKRALGWPETGAPKQLRAAAVVG